MSHHRSSHPWVRIVVAGCLLFAALSSQPAWAAGDPSATPNSTQPVSSEPDDTESGDTEPDGTEPDDGTAAGADDGVEGQDVTALTWLAVIGTLAVVGVAAWWMVRHGEVERRVGRMDDDWPGESDVI